MRQAVPRAGVIGWPVRHSRSPLIHGQWLRRYGLAGSYETIEVAPDDLGSFVGALRRGEWTGCNVTVPHKVAIAPEIDRLDATAAALSAVNTVWREGERLIGSNTDVYGFLAHLDAAAPGWMERVETALVIGAGGAARAIVYALLARDVPRLVIANRNRARAEGLCEALQCSARLIGLDDLPLALPEADLLINATALGMTGKPPLEIDLDPLPADALVYDIVYVPLETPLLAAARRRGLHVVDGLGMLLHQAVPGFARWFGVEPEVDDGLRQVLLRDLAAA